MKRKELAIHCLRIRECYLLEQQRTSEYKKDYQELLDHTRDAIEWVKSIQESSDPQPAPRQQS